MKIIFFLLHLVKKSLDFAHGALFQNSFGFRKVHTIPPDHPMQNQGFQLSQCQKQINSHAVIDLANPKESSDEISIQESLVKWQNPNQSVK